MTTTTAPGNRITHTMQPAPRTGPFAGELYRYHGFTVLDRNGQRVGIVDWIWTNDRTGDGDHLGLHLQWLRGKARAVPAAGARIDREGAVVQLPYTARQMASAPRFKVDRPLSMEQRAAIATHFAPTIPEAVGGSVSAPIAA